MNVLQQPVILVIDQEAAVRRAVRAYLEAYGYTVLEAENGRTGLRIHDSSPVDLILADLHLPGMDGFEILSEIRRHDPDLPVVLTSGIGDISEIVEALHLGATGYLLKPVHDMSMLVHAIKKGLDQASMPRENRKCQGLLEAKLAGKSEELTAVHSRLQAVVESIRRLLGCGEMDESGPLLLEEFGRHLKARGGSFYAVSEHGLRWIHSLDGDHAICELPMPLPSETVFSRGISALEPFIIEDIIEDGRPGSGWDGYSSPCCIVFPFRNHNGRVFAVVTLHNPEHGTFAPHDLEIGAILASFAAEALQTAEALAMVKHHEELLLQSRKLEAAGTLAGGIAHDFNNILSAIVGYTDLSLLAEDLPQRLKTNLEQIKKASRRAQDLVQQILAFSKIEESKVSQINVVPVSGEAIPWAGERSEPASHPSDFHMPRGNERILFVDDEETLAEMAGEMLKRLGYTVRVMTDGGEAGKDVKSDPNHYDLVIIDQAMPGISGIELAQAIMAIRPKMPIILYSGYPATISEDEARGVGIRKVLMKPLSMVLLSRAVRQILDDGAAAT